MSVKWNESLTADEVVLCLAYADTWFRFARLADEVELFDVSKRFRDVASDIHERLERRLEGERSSGVVVHSNGDSLIDHLLGAGYRGLLWSDQGDTDDEVKDGG